MYLTIHKKCENIRSQQIFQFGLNNFMNPRRIAIVGIGGSGKTTLSREIAKKAGLPLFHIDQIIWKGEWIEVPEEEYLVKHKELIEKDEWVIEGFLDDKMNERVIIADLVIHLDYSGLLSGYRFVKRWFKHRNHSRPEFPVEATEKLNLRIFLGVLRRFERKYIIDALKFVDRRKVVTIKNPKQLEAYLQNSWRITK